jgi:hypothetical protein
MSTNNGGPEEIVGFFNRCKETEAGTMFVIYRTMNSNTVLYKSKIENSALIGVEPEWIMCEFSLVLL